MGKKALISLNMGESLSQVCNWRDSIWRSSISERKRGLLGYNASLFEAVLSLDEDGDLLIDGEYVPFMSIYINRLGKEFIDEEFEEGEDFSFLFE